MMSVRQNINLSKVRSTRTLANTNINTSTEQVNKKNISQNAKEQIPGNTKNEMKNEKKNELKVKLKRASTKKKISSSNTVRLNTGELPLSLKTKGIESLATSKFNTKEKSVSSKKKEKKSTNQNSNNINTNINSNRNNNLLPSTNNSTNKETMRLQNSPIKFIEDIRKEKDFENLTLKKKSIRGKGRKLSTSKKEILTTSRLPKGKSKIKSTLRNDVIKFGINDKQLKRSKSCFNPTTSKLNFSHAHIHFSDISDNDDEEDSRDVDVEDGIEKQREQEMLKEKVMEKYKNIFETYKIKVKDIIKTDSSHSLKMDFSRSSLNHLMKMSCRCYDFNLSILCAILLLLDRLQNTEIELTDIEKENIENSIISYGIKSTNSYKLIFKIQYKKQYKETNTNTNKENNIWNKSFFDNLRIKKRNEIILHLEILINLINCILYTVEYEVDQIFFIHIRGQLYKLMSDVTKTGIKYKYEKMTQESYEQALTLANKYLAPTNITYLKLVYNYTCLLYFVVEQEQEALDLCKDAFDKASQELDTLDDNVEIEKCLQALSKIHYNIRSWSNRLNKDMLLFLKF